MNRDVEKGVLWERAGLGDWELRAAGERQLLRIEGGRIVWGWRLARECTVRRWIFRFWMCGCSGEVWAEEVEGRRRAENVVVDEVGVIEE